MKLGMTRFYEVLTRKSQGWTRHVSDYRMQVKVHVLIAWSFHAHSPEASSAVDTWVLLEPNKEGQTEGTGERARLPINGDTCKEAYEDPYSVAGGGPFYRLTHVMPILCSCALGGRFVRLQYSTVRSTMEETFKRDKMRAI